MIMLRSQRRRIQDLVRSNDSGRKVLAKCRRMLEDDDVNKVDATSPPRANARVGPSAAESSTLLR
jgi:hypothetical protein